MAAAHATGATRLLSPLCASALMIAFVTGPSVRSSAQTISTPSTLNARASASPGAEAEASELQLLVGRSAVLNIGTPITRVSLTSPDVADALVTNNQQLLVHGKAPGTISMFVWDRAGGIKRYEVVVQRDLSQLAEQLRQLFPGEEISVDSNGRDVVIAGTVSSKYVMERAADVAAGYVDKKENVVNLLRQQEGVASNQVLLRVRFAEVSRTALTELGASFFTGANGYKDYVGRSTTQQFAAPFFDEENGQPKLVFSDYLNLFVFNNKEGLGGVIKALQNKGLFQSLAEPNLIAENGKEASFLAGGEFPYPVAQGQAGNLSITIVFKEFGIRLRFTPTVLGGDLISLKVAPEVSSLDFQNAVVANGFRVPALTTRRTETEVELRDGQTFAIAGLLNNNLTSTMQKIPGIGDIPILGLLFRSKAAQKAQTELVVMITPQIVRGGAMGAAQALPNLIEPYLKAPKKQVAPPAPWLGPTPPGGSARATPAVPMPTNLQPQLAAAPAQPEPIVKMPPQPAPKAVAAVTPLVPARAGKPAAAEISAEPEAPPPAPASETAPSAAVQPAATTSASSGDARKATKQERQAAERAMDAQKKQEKADREAAVRDAEARLKQEKIDAKTRREEAERAAEQAKVDQKRAAEAREQAEKLAAEQARRDAETAKKLAAERARNDAEVAKRQAQIAKKRADEAKKAARAEQKREKELAEAEARLRAVQAEYQAEVERSKKDKAAMVPQPDRR